MLRAAFESVVIEIAPGCDGLDGILEGLPNCEAVFLVRAGERSAYLARTKLLRRRLQRIFRVSAGPSRGFNLRGIATSLEYWIAGSGFESTLLHYRLARDNFPDDYLKLVKLPMPAYVKLIQANAFPRTQVTTRLSASRSLYYGPFRTRAAAEQFENKFLDLFQIRRCQEDLAPRPDHPGCIYGEMNRCLRPCQQVVGLEEYASEVERVYGFLKADGATLLHAAAAARDRLSDEMDFEAAARQHGSLERIQAVLGLRDELARDIDRAFGVVVTNAPTAGAVRLWFLLRGCWQPPQDFELSGISASLDQRLREITAALRPERVGVQERQEHLAILARWYYSSWRDAEWIAFDDLDRVPYRKLVRAISKTVEPKK